MSNSKIIIIGRSGSGKTTLATSLVKDHGKRLARLHTSRKKRKHEEGYDYHFTTPEYFSENKESFIFIQQFTDTEVKLYGLDIDEYDAADVCIFAPEYFEFFSKEQLSKMKVIFLDVPKSECIRRQLSRGDDIEQVTKRASNDDKIFFNLRSYLDSLGLESLTLI
jgi:guanylate kinase